MSIHKTVADTKDSIQLRVRKQVSGVQGTRFYP